MPQPHRSTKDPALNSEIGAGVLLLGQFPVPETAGQGQVVLSPTSIPVEVDDDNIEKKSSENCHFRTADHRSRVRYG